MILGMGVAAGRLIAQDCPAVARIQPAGSLSGTLDGTSCLLNDGSAYTAW